LNDIYNNIKEVHLVSLFDDAENISYEKASRKEKVKKMLPKSLFENYRRKLGMTNIRDLRLREDVENDNLKVSRKFGKKQ
jgi:hypothetical protein